PSPSHTAGATANPASAGKSPHPYPARMSTCYTTLPSPTPSPATPQSTTPGSQSPRQPTTTRNPQDRPTTNPHPPRSSELRVPYRARMNWGDVGPHLSDPSARCPGSNLQQSLTVQRANGTTELLEQRHGLV